MRNSVEVDIQRRFVEVPAGTIHCAVAGSGPPVLLLHQTPRSWDEYRDVLPILGQRFLVVAMDTLGFGDSAKPPADGDSVERWAESARDLLAALRVQRVAVVGHHTGAAIAVELAAAYPEVVSAAVLSSTPFPARERSSRPPDLDEVEPAEDGSHLTELWRRRQPFYPPGRIDLLERFVVDAVRAGSRAASGHRVVARYDILGRLRLVRCPVLLIAATDDPFAYPSTSLLRTKLCGSALTEIPGGMVPLPDQFPVEFAGAVEEFLACLSD